MISVLDWAVEFIPQLFNKLNSLMIADGVSVLGFSIAVTILCILIAALLMRA